MALAIRRRVGESILIGDNVTITLLKVMKDNLRLINAMRDLARQYDVPEEPFINLLQNHPGGAASILIKAPREITILREEIYQKKIEEGCL